MSEGQEQSAISSQLSTLNNAVVDMGKGLETLEQKLSPVLSPPAPTPEGSDKETEKGVCGAADTIIAIRLRARANICQLNSIIERIQV